MHHLFREAQRIAKMSPDPSTKVGAVITVGPQPIMAAYNQFPPGVPEEWWHDRSKKYNAVIHAEAGAILGADRLPPGAMMVCTAHPCKECAKLIIAAGIRVVMCPPGPWRDDPAVIETVRIAAELFEACGVTMLEPMREI